MHTRHTILTLAAASLALVAPGATAHDTPPARELVAQASPEGLQIMVVHREPANDRVTLLRQRFDLNKDGHFDAAETQLVQKVWAKHVVAGLRFEVVGERPRIEEPRLKLGLDADGALNSAFLMTFTLPELAPGKDRALNVLLEEGDQSATAVTFQGVGGLGVRTASGELAGSVAAVTLTPGMNLTARFARVEATEAPGGQETRD